MRGVSWAVPLEEIGSVLFKKPGSLAANGPLVEEEANNVGNVCITGWWGRSAAGDIR